MTIDVLLHSLCAWPGLRANKMSGCMTPPPRPYLLPATRIAHLMGAAWSDTGGVHARRRPTHTCLSASHGLSRPRRRPSAFTCARLAPAQPSRPAPATGRDFGRSRLLVECPSHDRASLCTTWCNLADTFVAVAPSSPARAPSKTAIAPSASRQRNPCDVRAEHQSVSACDAHICSASNSVARVSHKSPRRYAAPVMTPVDVRYQGVAKQPPIVASLATSLCRCTDTKPLRKDASHGRKAHPSRVTAPQSPSPPAVDRRCTLPPHTEINGLRAFRSVARR